MDNFDNNNMGGFEPQKPFTERPVQNNNMNTEQTIPVSEPETQEEQAQNVQPQNGNTPYGDYISATTIKIRQTMQVRLKMFRRISRIKIRIRTPTLSRGSTVMVSIPTADRIRSIIRTISNTDSIRTTQDTIRMYLRISRICTDSSLRQQRYIQSAIQSADVRTVPPKENKGRNNCVDYRSLFTSYNRFYRYDGVRIFGWHKRRFKQRPKRFGQFVQTSE